MYPCVMGNGRDQSFVTVGAGEGLNLKTVQRLCALSIFVKEFKYPIEK